jgi:hypothetical protein
MPELGLLPLLGGESGASWWCQFDPLDASPKRAYLGVRGQDILGEETHGEHRD